MTSKELIDALQYHIENADMPLSDGDAKEIILKLKEFEELVGIIDTCYLGIVKAYTMLRLGEIRDER